MTGAGIKHLPWAALVILSTSACGDPESAVEFPVAQIPAQARAYEWTTLAEDDEGDGQRRGSADGKSFSYFWDTAADTIWFRFELFSGFDPKRPSVSVAVDTDSNQHSGLAWYGANGGFRFEKLLSVGPTRAVGDTFVGYNGITDQEGVTNRDWTNERRGVLRFYLDPDALAYVLAVARNDIDPHAREILVIGSVGSNARWNDDIGEEGFGTIVLNRRSSP